MANIIKKNDRKNVELDVDGRPKIKFNYIPIIDSYANKNLLYMVKLDELKSNYEEYIGPIDINSE